MDFKILRVKKVIFTCFEAFFVVTEIQAVVWLLSWILWQKAILLQDEQALFSGPSVS